MKKSIISFIVISCLLTGCTNNSEIKNNEISSVDEKVETLESKELEKDESSEEIGIVIREDEEIETNEPEVNYTVEQEIELAEITNISYKENELQNKLIRNEDGIVTSDDSTEYNTLTVEYNYEDKFTVFENYFFDIESGEYKDNEVVIETSNLFPEVIEKMVGKKYQSPKMVYVGNTENGGFQYYLDDEYVEMGYSDTFSELDYEQAKEILSEEID